MEPTEDDVAYAREIYTPHRLGPDHGQVLVRWLADDPEKRTWHWPHELRVDTHLPESTETRSHNPARG
ncbi:MAG: hypothetical protein M3235_02075 [Actinomycetota bacterium]|nr:hypothetical protein [Actinomycetota bacterium]